MTRRSDTRILCRITDPCLRSCKMIRPFPVAMDFPAVHHEDPACLKRLRPFRAGAGSVRSSFLFEIVYIQLQKDLLLSSYFMNIRKIARISVTIIYLLFDPKTEIVKDSE